MNSKFGFESPFSDEIDKLLDTIQQDAKTFRETYENNANMEVLLSKLSSSKDANVRYQCMKVLNDGLGGEGEAGKGNGGAVARIAALSLSAVAGSWLIESQERNYKGLRSRRNLDNDCPDKVVESLLSAVRSVGVTY